MSEHVLVHGGNMTDLGGVELIGPKPRLSFSPPFWGQGLEKYYPLTCVPWAYCFYPQSNR